MSSVTLIDLIVMYMVRSIVIGAARIVPRVVWRREYLMSLKWCMYVCVWQRV